MNLDGNVEQRKLIQIASLVIVKEDILFAAVLSSRRRRLNPPEPALKIKVGRRIYDRPVYTCSTWWTMLLKGDCKVEGHPQNKVSRRRFSVLYSM